MLKYIIYPGYVRSENDKEPHFISASQLIQLYNVNPNECMLHGRGGINVRGINRKDLKNLISLYPRRDGNYNRKNP